MSEKMIEKITEQEAIEIFQELLDVPKNMLVRYDHVANEEQKEKINKVYLAEQMAIKALEKQIPKKPIFEDGFIGVYKCPVCKMIVGNPFGKGIAYCPECGHAIDWSEEE